MGQLAQKMGFAFENNNVNVKLSNPYFWSNYMQQARALAQHAGINMILDRDTLAIWTPIASGLARAGIAGNRPGRISDLSQGSVIGKTL
jgi:hypothetical protein